MSLRNHKSRRGDLASTASAGAGVIVWDLDGTLLDSARDIAAALNGLLDSHALPAQTVEAVTTMIGGGVARLIERGFARAGRPLAPSAAESLVGAFRLLYAESSTTHSSLYPGVAQTLDALAAAGYRQAVCTNKPHSISVDVLARLGVGHHFRAVVGGDSTPHTKPHPAPLLACLRLLQAGTDRAVMVGDSIADVEVARAVGIPVVAVMGGYSAVPASELGADAVIDRVDELPALLARERLHG